ncbi:sensory box protein [Geofilum rubicundum JCM 15548]|uniref:Sensory box protein n=1 Tax=Geofilum rubicundum JCM 15548 TaxID=1236989 RepID=A0A0E9LZN9_9BACT|nr:sensory box protein [Geofilum rubicundum JCM 15548]
MGQLPLSTLIRHYEEGYMTPEQVNLLLRYLPVDITYVDENDRVIFYNRGEDRVFPRSKGVIGREVKFCHPPKSVHMVLRIVEEFKAGTKDVAEFWINFKGRMIHIRYFAIRDKEKNYRGVIEMSQDVTDIQKLEGQKRLLDWD